MEWSRKYISEWQEARKRKVERMFSKVPGGNQSTTRWFAPQECRLKLNVDASVMSGMPYFSVGMILRDHNGSLLRACTVKSAGEVSAFEAEVWGVREALRWLSVLQVKEVDIESDSLLTVTSLQRKQII